jgi:DeoR/GlpR family transcriptional regulator of sugar metabolism
VATRATTLECSQVTIRKDLDVLEERGMLRREHGYAVIDQVNNVGNRMCINFNTKVEIAKAAAAIVEDGETVLIESGSCCALLAEELANTKHNITIVTNSVFIANSLSTSDQVKVILLGGEYMPEAQVMVGSITRNAAQVFFSDKFFIGAGGFNDKYGFTGKNHARAQTIRDMAEQAQEVIVLTDSDKFNVRGVQGLVQADRVSQVFTDEGIPSDKEQLLQKKQVKVHKVPCTN